MLDRKIRNELHVSLLKPYFEDKFGRIIEPPPPVQQEDEQKEIEVEKIPPDRRKRRKIQHMVQWIEYPDHRNEWLSQDELSNYQKLLKVYKNLRIVNYN